MLAAEQLTYTERWRRENMPSVGLIADGGQAARLAKAIMSDADLLRKANPHRISRLDPRFALEKERSGKRLLENQQLFGGRLQDHLGDYRDGKITRYQAERRMKREIREHYRTAFELGKRMAGNLYLLTPKEERWLRKLRYDEFRYLRNFLDDIDADRGVLPYPRRMDMYEKAIREVAWMGWLVGNRSPFRRIIWHWSPEKEHCDDCASLAIEGRGHPWTVQSFIKYVRRTGHLPQSGTLACLGYHCGCWLEETFVGGNRTVVEV